MRRPVWLHSLAVGLGRRSGIWHQSFTPGRMGNDPGDWLADFTGGLLGGWLAAHFVRWISPVNASAD